MAHHKASSNIDGTSALKVNCEPARFIIIKGADTSRTSQDQSFCVARSSTPLYEESYFSDDVHIALQASGLSDVLADIKQGSMSGMPTSLSWPGVFAIAGFTFIIALLIIV